MMDVIKYEGEFWLVPEWWVKQSEGWKAPERVVHIGSLDHSHFPENFGFQFLIQSPVPKLVFETEDLSQLTSEYLVYIGPDIRLPIKRGAN